MDSILQGTTPTLTIAIDPTDFAVSDIVALELRIKQKNNLTIYNLPDVTLDPAANTVAYHFSEVETLALFPDIWFNVQLRFWFADGNICGTDPMSFNVDELIGAEGGV